MKKIGGSLIALCLLSGVVILLGQGASAERGNAMVADAPDADFDQFKAYFHKKTDEGALSGTVMLLYQDGRTWIDAYGKREIASGLPMTEDAIFRMASMTKPITSVAAMMLVESGALRLEDPIEKYLPGYVDVPVLREDGSLEAPHRLVTVKDLLLHTSGIANSMFRNTAAEQKYREALKDKKPRSLEELVGFLSKLPLAHHPGQHWTYGFSTDVLGRVVEVASGEKIDVFFEKRIFQPLEMHDTGFQVPEEKRDRFTAAYGKELALLDAPNAQSPYATGANYPRGASGLASTAHDYLRFCRMLLQKGELDGKRILKAETVELMMQNHLPEGVWPHTPGMPVITNGFGLGFGVQTSPAVIGTAGDAGWPGAFMTYFFVDPTHNGIGIFLSQSGDFANLPVVAEFHAMASALFAGSQQVGG